MKKILIFIVIFLIGLTPVVFAENRSPNNELPEEIDIAEATLNVLLSPDRGGIPFPGPNAIGYYLPDYGVIFSVNYHSGLYIFKMANIPAKSKETNQFFLNSRVKEEQKNLIPGLKKRIIRFFNNYASTLTGLKPDEKITIILDLTGSVFRQFDSKDSFPTQLTGTVSMGDSIPSQLIATVSMGDIINYKERKSSLKELEKRITFSEIKSIDDETEIFSDVIKSSFKHISGYSGPDLSGNVKSIYIKGLGIVFMADAGVGIKINLIAKNVENIIRGTLNNLNNIYVTTKPSKESGAKTDSFKNYEEKLIKLIAKYGYTLSKIKKDEWIIIALNFNRLGINNRFPKSVIKVKKSDIDDFNKGKIDFKNFEKKVSVFHF